MNLKPIEARDLWRFGTFEFEASSRELRKQGLRVHIQEQPARVLRALLENPGEVVGRETLKDLLWPDETYVDFERSLNATVAKLRQVLLDSAEQPRYIATEARRGYRFIAQVEKVSPQPKPVPVDVISEPVRWKLWLGAGVLLVAAAGFIFDFSRSRTPSSPEVIQFLISPPEGTRIHSISSVSQDGRKVAFVAMDAAGGRELWVRAFASETAIRLEHTKGAQAPFFSPDGEEIGFFAQGKLQKIAAFGGTPTTLCEVNQPGGGTWNRGNVIIFSQQGRLYRIASAGGQETMLARLPAAAGSHVVDTWPQFLMDGKRFLVSSTTYARHANPTLAELQVGSLDSSQRQSLLNNPHRGILTPDGQLLFLKQGTLYVQKLNGQQNQLTGEPRPLAENIPYSAEGMIVDSNPGMPRVIAGGAFAISSNGVLVYHTFLPPPGQLVWMDRTGKRLGVIGEPQRFTQISLSPNEHWAAVGVRSDKRAMNQNIWLMNLQTGVLSRLSYGEGIDGDPVWAPGSDRIVFGAQLETKGPKIELLESPLSGLARPFFVDGNANKPEAFTPDGSSLLIRRDEQYIYRVAVDGENKKPLPVMVTPHFKGRLTVSPDGRWLAYMSAESGRPEVYLTNYPAMTVTRQVSAEGGGSPVWRKDGKELFYMTDENKIMSLEFRPDSGGIPGRPKMLFQPNVMKNTWHMGQYGVAANGEKFLVNEMQPPKTPPGGMHVVVGWNKKTRN